MPVIVNCASCNKTQEPYLDSKSDKVFCSQCENEIQSNHFMKVQLKTLKQFKVKTTTPFMVKCPSCNKEDTPVKNNGKVCCAGCSKPLNNLTDIFKNMLMDHLDKINKDV